jgi:CHAT domain-containing protein
VLAGEGQWAKALEVWEGGRGTSTSGTVAWNGPGAYVVFASLPGGMAAWVIDSSRIDGAWLKVGESDLRKEAELFLRDCADPNSTSAAWTQRARQLYTWLFQPLEPLLQHTNTMVVEGTEPVVEIPIRALIGRGGLFLGQRFAVVFADGLEAYQRRADRGREFLSTDTSALVVADPALQGEVRNLYPPLADAATEASSITRHFPRARVVGGAEATPQAIAPLIANTELFHFAGHAVFNRVSGGLLMAPGAGGEFDLFDVRRIRDENWAGCQLVVLSACSTDAGRNKGSRHPDTLAGAFLRAGARRVIASHWNVDSAATAGFMSEFYAELAARVPPSEALRQAADTIRQRTPEPYYWANFDLYGYR